jgi:kumamolisin
VDFPASSPHALACGGTKLLADPATGVISSEVVWNETAANEGAGGGGVSDEFALPSWQADAGVPARAGSDSGAGAGPGGRGVASGQRFGLIQTLLYAGVTPGTAAPGFRDITSGNNGAYTAGPGWDACSGLGSPDGTALLNRLQG